MQGADTRPDRIHDEIEPIFVAAFTNIMPNLQLSQETGTSWLLGFHQAVAHYRYEWAPAGCIARQLPSGQREGSRKAAMRRRRLESA